MAITKFEQPKCVYMFCALVSLVVHHVLDDRLHSLFMGDNELCAITRSPIELTITKNVRGVNIMGVER